MKTTIHDAIRLLSLAGAAALMLPGGTAEAQGRKQKPDDMVAVGKPVSCITLNRIRSTRVRDDRTIDFEMIGREVYRNRLPNSCPGLGFEERFAYRASTSQLCSVDTITVLRSGGGWGFMQGPTCGLGQFQKMAKPGRPAR